MVTTSDMTVKLACEKITEKSLICEAMISDYKKVCVFITQFQILNESLDQRFDKIMDCFKAVRKRKVFDSDWSKQKM